MTSFWIIAAISDNDVIGRANALPWRIPDDLARFKTLTMGHTLIMGRKTYESIGRPLPGRTTVVLTRRKDFAAPGVLVAHDVGDLASLIRDPEAFVIGGTEVFTLFLPLASKLFITRVHARFDGDAYFPDFDASAWRLVSSERRPASGATPAITFQEYQRASPAPDGVDERR